MTWFLASGRVRRRTEGAVGVEITATRPMPLVVAPEEFSDAVVEATPILEEPEADLPEEPAESDESVAADQPRGMRR